MMHRFTRHFSLALAAMLAATLFAIFPPLVLANEFLPPDQAFRASVRALDDQNVEVHFDIAPGYYLYRDKFRFAVEPAGWQPGPLVLPQGKQKYDENFGDVEVYYQQVSIRLPLERNGNDAQPPTLIMTSQGCAENGICYPPQEHRLPISLPTPERMPMTPMASAPSTSSSALNMATNIPLNAGATNEAGDDETYRISRLFSEASLWLIVVSFFGFGLALSLTPCIWPMFPILSAMIVRLGAQHTPVSRSRGLALAFAYVFGMSATYAVAGIAAGLTGTLLSTTFQNPWAIGAFALIFVALALSMFGLYELQLPAFLRDRLIAGNVRVRGGALPNLALMGALSALLASPCVGPALAGALLYIGQSGNAPLGGAALFAMGLGMGTPLLVIGFSAGALLPKAGPWMETVKKIFGFILLGTAHWLICPFLPAMLASAGWGVLLIAPALLLGAHRRLPHATTGAQRAGKLLGIIMLITGSLLLVGTFSGKKSASELFAELSGENAKTTEELPFTPVRTVAEVEAYARAAGRPVMLDFYADWCVACKEMERKTFAVSSVHQALAGWTLLRADVTANSADDKALLARFRLYGPPGIIFFDKSGREISAPRVIGFQKAEEFIATVTPLSQ